MSGAVRGAHFRKLPRELTEATQLGGIVSLVGMTAILLTYANTGVPPRRSTRSWCSTCRRTSTRPHLQRDARAAAVPLHCSTSSTTGTKRLNVSGSDIVKQRSRARPARPLPTSRRCGGPRARRRGGRGGREHRRAEGRRAAARRRRPRGAAAEDDAHRRRVRGRGARGRAASSRCGSRCTSRWARALGDRSRRLHRQPGASSTSPSSRRCASTASTTSTRTRTSTATALDSLKAFIVEAHHSSDNYEFHPLTHLTHTSGEGYMVHGRVTVSRVPGSMRSPRSRSSTPSTRSMNVTHHVDAMLFAAPGAECPHLKAVTQAEQVRCNDEQFSRVPPRDERADRPPRRPRARRRARPAARDAGRAVCRCTSRR